MACAGSVVYKDDHLNISDATETKSLGVNEIAQIYHCLMEDEIHHGEESFHILVVDERFVLIGPFVAGALGAIEALIRAHPEIPVTRRLVRTVPYHYREAGFLGLRLFPVPGLKDRPISDLARFHCFNNFSARSAS